MVVSVTTVTLSPTRTQTAWWRWAVVLIPGLLLYWFALPGLNQQQGRLLAPGDVALVDPLEIEAVEVPVPHPQRDRGQQDLVRTHIVSVGR
jgi:hypothetical protein